METNLLQYFIDINCAENAKPPSKDFFSQAQCYDIAIKHGLSGFLYKKIKPDEAFFSEKILKAFQQKYYQDIAHYRRRKAKFCEIVKVLNQVDIYPVIFKGVAMVEFFYKDPGLRPMGDFDFWVEKSDIRKVEEILLSLNLAREIEAKVEVLRWNYDHQLSGFFDSNSGLYIEPHWAFFGKRFGFGFNDSEIIEDAEIVNIGGCFVRKLSNPAYAKIAFYTLKKGFFEGANRFGRVIDILKINPDLKPFKQDKNIKEIVIEYEQLISWIPQKGKSKLVESFFGKNKKKTLSVIWRILFSGSSFFSTTQAFLTLAFPSLAYVKQKNKIDSNFKAIIFYFIRPFIGFKSLFTFLKKK